MKTVEELRAKIIDWANHEENDELLEEFSILIDSQKPKRNRLSEQEEAALNRGLEDYKAGNWVDEKEAWEQIRSWRQERKDTTGNAR